MRKPLFIMVAVLVLAACSHKDEGSSDPLHDMQEMAVAEAWRDFDADKLDTALLKVDAVLKTAPGNLSAMRLKSMILVSLGRTGEAVKVLEELARCEPGDLDIRHILGTIYFKREKWEKASKHLEQAMAAPERAEKASELLVVCYENLGQLDRSISLLEKMLKDKPEDPVLLTHTGNLLASSGRYAQAIERFSGALERDRYFARAERRAAGACVGYDSREIVAVWNTDSAGLAGSGRVSAYVYALAVNPVLPGDFVNKRLDKINAAVFLVAPGGTLVQGVGADAQDPVGMDDLRPPADGKAAVSTVTVQEHEYAERPG